jgi:membrane-associated protein
MSFTKFVTYNTIGSIVWAIVFGWLGYYFGRDLPLLEKYISRVSFGVLIVGVIVITIFVVIKRRRSKAAAAVGGEPGAAIGESKTLS